MRQTQVGSLVNAAATMANINRAEQSGELDEAQAATLRARLPYISQFEIANIRRLKAEAEKLEKTNPGAAEAQAARTKYEQALTDALTYKTGFERRTEGLSTDILRLNLDKVRQDIEQGKAEIEVQIPNGPKVKVNAKQYLDYLTRISDGRGAGALTEQNIIENRRKEIEDLQREEKEARAAEDKIINNPQADNTVLAETHNQFSNNGYVYLPTPRNLLARGMQTFGLGPTGEATVKIPLPKHINARTGKKEQMTAREAYDIHRTLFSTMSFREFLVHYYTNVLKEPLPKELQ